MQAIRMQSTTGVSYSVYFPGSAYPPGDFLAPGLLFPDKYGLLHWSLNFRLSDLQSTENDSTSGIYFLSVNHSYGRKRPHQLPIIVVPQNENRCQN